MKVKVYTVHAFAKSIEGGNPAGIVLNADFLSEKNMKKISKIIGFSETAFVMKSDYADFKVRFFTPNKEVNLCGHATIGTYHTLLSEGYITPGSYSQETEAAILNVNIDRNFSVMMNQTTPTFYETISMEEIADSLNIGVSEMDETLPVQIVSTGLKDIIVPIKNIDILNCIKPNFDKIKQISYKYNSVGYHLFTFETLHGSTAHCRNFAPLYDILEESATGTSNGALGCYLYKYGKIDSKQAENIIFEQGYSMKKPSEIIVSLTIKEDEIAEVMVGGKALNLSSVEVEI